MGTNRGSDDKYARDIRQGLEGTYLQSMRNIDKTHLSNGEDLTIAAHGKTDMRAASPSFSRSYSSERAIYGPQLTKTESLAKQNELAEQYNSAAEGDEGAGAPEGKETNGDIFRVMSHNFGKTKTLFQRNDSQSGREGRALETAYMHNRKDELERTSSVGSRRAACGEGESEGVKLWMCSEEEHAANLEVLSGWDFCAWHYSKDELVKLAWSMYHEFGLIEAFQIPAAKFRNFILAVFATSHGVPYHNHEHYFSVLQSSWLFFQDNPFSLEYLTKTDLLGCLTAAIGHDADHPGLTNSFLSATRHELSIRYNDLSILENHHCATTYTILTRSESNIFCNLTTKQWKDVRNVIVSAVLNTDMARHFNLVANFVDTFQDKPAAKSFSNRTMRNQIISMVVHCADISNPIKPWAICKRFADAVAEEFRTQVKLERANGIPCTPHMLGLDLKGQAKMELGFIDVFTYPAMEALNKVLPSMKVCFANMEQNRIFWQDVLESAKSANSTPPHTPPPSLKKGKGGGVGDGNKARAPRPRSKEEEPPQQGGGFFSRFRRTQK